MENLLKRALTISVVLAGAIWAVAAAPSSRVADDPAVPPRVPAVFPATWRFPAGAHATFAQHAIGASSDLTASAGGADIIKEGGNAVDAAVGTGFALAVTYPEAGNVGCGGYLVIRVADGRTGARGYR